MGQNSKNSNLKIDLFTTLKIKYVDTFTQLEDPLVQISTC
mgnify:CR=1 FL=1